MMNLPYQSRVCSRAGTPKPISVIHRITGTPRTMSMYRVANSRTGYSAGARTLRPMAISRPTTTMHGAHHRKIWTSYQNGPSSSGKTSRKTSALKNDSWTFCHPDVFGSSHTSSPTTTAVLRTAVEMPRRRRARS